MFTGRFFIYYVYVLLSPNPILYKSEAQTYLDAYAVSAWL